jgi:hypothetical protein
MEQRLLVTHINPIDKRKDGKEPLVYVEYLQPGQRASRGDGFPSTKQFVSIDQLKEFKEVPGFYQGSFEVSNFNGTLTLRLKSVKYLADCKVLSEVMSDGPGKG